MPPPLTEDDYQEAAQKLGCDVAAVKAVAEVESGPHGAFLPSGDPVILFERHKFSKFTGGKYDQSNPGISNRAPGGYGPVSQQHARFQEAAALDADRRAAILFLGALSSYGISLERPRLPQRQRFCGRYVCQ